MNKRTGDTLMDAALSDLDPSARTELTEAENARADTMFARIVAAPIDESVPAQPARPPQRRRRLLVTLGLAGAAGVGIPMLLLGGGTAYGSWTPKPESLSGVAATEAATTCRAALGHSDSGDRIALAERRGDWTYVLLTGPGTESVCLMPNDLVGENPGSATLFFGSYDPDAPAPPPLGKDHFNETTSGEGSTEEGWFAWTQGYVGNDVTGVTVHTSTGLDIEASVTGNRFAAWWPSTVQSSENPAESWSYTVHLADGSSRNVR